MKSLIGALAVALFVGFVPPALAEKSQAWTLCKQASADPDLLIGACTDVIDSRSESIETRPAAHSVRSLAHGTHKNYQTAIVDINKATKTELIRCKLY